MTVDISPYVCSNFSMRPAPVALDYAHPRALAPQTITLRGAHGTPPAPRVGRFAGRVYGRPAVSEPAGAFCLSGDTRILMANGETRLLADVRTGDAVFGTAVQRGRRRAVVTKVIQRWTTTKPAHRVTLDDSTELVTSSDHRFLTDRGWKFVLGNSDHRPYLTIGRRLMGMSADPTSPVSAGSPVRAIESLGTVLEMFDLTTDTGDFIANGVVSHNCLVQITSTARHRRGQ